MTVILNRQFNRINEGLDYMEYIKDPTSDTPNSKIFGIIGPVNSGKNRLISYVLTFRNWVNRCKIIDFSLYLDDEDSLAIIKSEIQSKNVENILWLKNGEMRPKLLLNVLDDMDIISRFDLVLYTYVCDLEKGQSVSLSYLSVDEIIPFFSSLSEVPARFGLTLSDMHYKTVGAFRSVNLIYDISNYLRDITVMNKKQLLEILWSWQDALWNNHGKVLMPYYNTVEGIIQN